MITITKQHIEKIDYYCSFGLVKGLGERKEGGMCVEAMIATVLGKEKHTDNNNDCVLPLLNSIKIALNDSVWSSNIARAKGMRNLAIAQLGTAGFDTDEFDRKLKEHSNKRILPYLVQKHKEKEPEEAGKLDELCVGGWNEETRVKVYHNYYYYNNYYYYYYYYNYHNLGDTILLLVADTILDVLKEMKSPGCEWL